MNRSIEDSLPCYRSWRGFWSGVASIDETVQATHVRNEKRLRRRPEAYLDLVREGIGEAPEIPPENFEAWDHVLQSRCGDRMLAALHLVASGSSFREAAQAVGFKTHSTVFKAARQYGLVSVHSERLLDVQRENAFLAGEEFHRRLLETPESVSDRDLIVGAGVAIDKVAKKERWGLTDQEVTGSSAFDQALRALAEAGCEIRVELSPAAPREPDTVDVTADSSLRATGIEDPAESRHRSG